MPILKNPFARRGAPPALVLGGDTSSRPASRQSARGFESVETVGSMASSVMSIGGRKSQDTGEYQMSVVNDSGVWVPPSPAEEKKAWPRRYLSSRSSSDTHSSLGDIEPFSISRESFDSYRRSFDIAAKSPVHASPHDSPARQSLDSSRFSRVPRTTFADLEPPTLEEESFEDVGLDDQKAPPRRRGFFFRYSDPQEEEERHEDALSPPSSPSMLTAPAATMSRFLMPGRKQKQSQLSRELGAELGVIKPAVDTALPQVKAQV
jgi:hypothetical protein